MKKIGIVFLALLLSLVCFLPAFAEEPAARDFSFENSLAADLKALGLFNGVSDTNFDLERAPSRVEVLVMLIRVLGEEKTATEGQWKHPFTDVAAWADPYVGYAYEHGLTKGVSATKFGTGTANAATYLTFVLRALGYSDADGDFAWDNPYPLAKGLGILPSFADTDNFLRADIVTISYAALSAEMKNSSQLLAEKLIEAGAFSSEVYGANYDAAKIADRENASKVALSAEEIYAKCSPAVFYIEVQSTSGVALASGSGFFIDESGIAVTNWHVVDGAQKAVITLPGSGATYDVTGVYSYNVKSDYALIQVDGSGFKTLNINPFLPRGAADVYAIGSPKGLQNTISAGIVSNPRRVIEGSSFIQTNAAISGGSSGGVLLNRYGEVIGITSNSYADGQNLNFARPISCIAAAKTDTATPLESVNWNYIHYEMENYDLTVKVGEVYTVEYDMYYYTKDNALPKCSIESSDPEVATASFGFDEWFVRIIGKKEGTAVFTVTDDLSDEKLVFNVTVVENAEQPLNVQYFLEAETIAMNPGATKQYRIQGVALNGDAVKMKVVKAPFGIQAEISYPEEYDFGILKVSGQNAGSYELVLGNDLDDAVYALPVTVGNQYETAFNALRDLLLEKGKLYSNGNTEDDHYYIQQTLSSYVIALLMYYPSEDTIYLRYYDSSTTPIIMDIWIDNNPDKVSLSLSIPALGVSGKSTFSPAGFGDGKRDSITFDEYNGPAANKPQLEDSALQMSIPVLLFMDYIIQNQLPELAISDFGFVDLDYAAYGYVSE